MHGPRQLQFRRYHEPYMLKRILILSLEIRMARACTIDCIPLTFACTHVYVSNLELCAACTAWGNALFHNGSTSPDLFPSVIFSSCVSSLCPSCSSARGTSCRCAYSHDGLLRLTPSKMPCMSAEKSSDLWRSLNGR